MRSLSVANLMMLLTLGAMGPDHALEIHPGCGVRQPDPEYRGNASFTLQVSRNTATGSTTSASLNYLGQSFAPDFSSFTFVQVVGQIPSTVFTGQTTADLVVNFNTSQLDPTTSISQSCTFVFATLTFTCTSPAPTGLISVEWKGNSAISSEVAIIREDTMGGFTTKVHQHSDNTTANATGTVFGVTVNPAAASVGVIWSSSRIRAR